MEPADWQGILTVLKSELLAGRVKVDDVETVAALRRIHTRADGTIDLSTVDSRVRSLALAVYGCVQAHEPRTDSLRDMQQEYFGTLTELVGHIFDWMKSKGLSPHRAATMICADDGNLAFSRKCAEVLPPLLHEFWGRNGPAMNAHLHNSQTMKAVYGGDVFPLYGSGLVTAVGLYADTLVVPDPLQRTTSLFDKARLETAAYHLIKHALTALSFRDLALADVDPPILVIGPDVCCGNSDVWRLIVSQAEDDARRYAQQLFGRDFPSMAELATFCDRLTSPEDVCSVLAAPERLLFDVERPGSPEEQVREHMQYEEACFLDTVVAKHAGECVRRTVLGRMLTTNELLFRSTELRGTPIIDAPTSWEYLVWKYDSDVHCSGETRPSVDDVFITKSLQMQGTLALRLLCRVSPEALIELRKRGALCELRQTMREGISEIDQAPETRLQAVAERVSKNLEAALARHCADMGELRRRGMKFFGYDVAPFMGAATIAILAATAVHPLVSLLAAGVGLVGIPNAREVWKKARQYIRDHRSAIRTPAAILYRHARSAQRAAARRRRKSR